MADKAIRDLPRINKLSGNDLLVVGVSAENYNPKSMTGQQLVEFAQEASVELIKVAQQAASTATAEADRANNEADRAQSIRDSIEVDYQALEAAVHQAEQSAGYAASSANLSDDHARTSESWAVGGTGTREGEDTNNAMYWANKAEAEADRATVPAVQGVYNVILTDRVTQDKYALIVDDGVLSLLGVSNTLDAVDLNLVDQSTGLTYAVVVESGVLTLEEV